MGVERQKLILDQLAFKLIMASKERQTRPELNFTTINDMDRQNWTNATIDKPPRSKLTRYSGTSLEKFDSLSRFHRERNKRHFRVKLTISREPGEIVEFPAVVEVNPGLESERLVLRLPLGEESVFPGDVYNALITVTDPERLPPVEAGRTWKLKDSWTKIEPEILILILTRGKRKKTQAREPVIQAAEFAEALKAISDGHFSVSPQISETASN